MVKTFFGGIGAGLMVGIGGTVYLSCENKVVGAVLFSVALLTILFLQMYLFTGKIGLFAENVNLKDAIALPIGLCGNWVGAVGTGLLVSFAKPNLVETASAICEKKLECSHLTALCLGLFCGILMYAAVKPFGLSKSIAGVVFAIPTFILCGFEHSIADMFYFSCGRIFSTERTIFLVLIVLGNTLGGMLIPFLMKIGVKKEQTNG